MSFADIYFEVSLQRSADVISYSSILWYALNPTESEFDLIAPLIQFLKAVIPLLGYYSVEGASDINVDWEF